jgi:thioredoxin reductase
MEYNKIIIGARFYGLYAALQCARKGEKVIVLERDDKSFSRATHCKQARVHMKDVQKLLYCSRNVKF